MLKLSHVSAVLLSQFVAADAGSLEAQHDARLCAVYTAYRCALKDGNKTQLMLVATACETYKSPKDCLALVGAAKVNAAAKHAHATYAAYKVALEQCGIPSLMKGATVEDVEAAAAAIAGEFVELVTVALTPEAKPEKTEEEKAAAKAKKEAEAKKAEKELKATIRAEAEKLAGLTVMTTDDVIRTAITAIKMGAVSADLLAELSDALDGAAITIDVQMVPVAEPLALAA